jgi:zinc/manganese transport system substrate-binding protein
MRTILELVVAARPLLSSAMGRLTSAFVVGVLLAACGASRQSAEPAALGRPLQVVTTFVPVTWFTQAVAGPCATVTALVPPGTDPHEFQARSADLLALRQARLLVKNGLGIEGFLDKLVASADNPGLRVIDSSRGVSTLDSHDRAHVHTDDHAHGHAAANPHIWLDPLRAVQQVEAIRDGLVKADPSCADGYRRNAAAYIGQLRQLNSEIAAQLKPYRGRTFVAFHDVAPYFAQRYGLKAAFLVDVPELNPSPADLQRVAAQVRQNQLQALLSGPQEGNRSFNALARDLGIRIGVFDPIETAAPQAAADPGTYLTVMRRNGAALAQVFAR